MLHGTFQTHLLLSWPHDQQDDSEENMDARPDQEKMEQAINKFLQLLEKQENKGFKDLATGSSPIVTVAEACTRIFLLHVCG